MKQATIGLAALCIVLAFGQAARAQTLTLTALPASISFPWSDPDFPPNPINANATVTVTYDIKGGGANPPFHITVRATGDLQSGSDSIPITNITWTGGGSPRSFTPAGTLTTTDQTLLTWSGKVTGTGTMLFHLANSWTYKAGNYTTTIVFTISTP